MPSARHLARATIGVAAASVGCGDATTTVDAFELEALPPLVLEEEVRIGDADDPDLGFSRVGGLAVDSLGRIYVLENLIPEIRVFDPSGRRERVIGRRGQGPGEMLSPIWMGIFGDTLWVTDLRRSTALAFTLDGELGREFRLGRTSFTPVDGSVRINLTQGHRRPDGLWEGVRSSMPIFDRPSNDSVSYPSVLFDGAGEVADTGGVEWRHFGPTVTIDGVLFFLAPTPLPDRPIISARFPDTMEVLRPVASSSERGSFIVTRWRGERDTVFSRIYRYRPLPVEPSYVDSVLLALGGEGLGGRGDPERAAPVLRDHVEFPEFHPPVTGAQLGEEGWAWLRREDLGSDAHTWLVLRPDGTPRGHVQVNRDIEIQVIRGHLIWVVEPDEFDVPWIVRYRVRER